MQIEYWVLMDSCEALTLWRCQNMKLRLKELRKRKRWSQSKLSKISGVARGYISEIESGKYTNPTADVICRLCKALGCTPSDLIICEEDDDDTRAT